MRGYSVLESPSRILRQQGQPNVTERSSDAWISGETALIGDASWMRVRVIAQTTVEPRTETHQQTAVTGVTSDRMEKMVQRLYRYRYKGYINI
jgi:hypothetical protein